MAELNKRIRKQLEFYFGDSNLPKDKFLRGLVASDPDGYVDLSVIASFSRIKSMTSDIKVIAEAIKPSEIVQPNEDGTRVRRVKPLPEKDTSNERSAYVKGFPKETTWDNLYSFFSTFGKVKAVRMKNEKGSKEFRGSAFVEFATEADLANFLKEKRSYKENELESTSKVSYIEKKKTEKRNQKRKRQEDLISEQKESFKKQYKDCIILVEGIGTENKDFSFKEIKEAFKSVQEKVYVEFPDGSDKAMVRFKDAEKAKEGLALCANTETPVKLNGSVVKASLLAGEAEDEFLNKLAAAFIQRRQDNNNPRKRKRKKLE